MDYRIYNPTVTHTTVIDTYTDASGLTFVGTPSIAYYGGKFWVAVEGSVGALSEGATSQRVWMKTATTAETLQAATAFAPFGDSAYCTNPITEPGYAAEWQPCFTVVGTELWCAWSSTDFGFLSKLTDPDGKWTNYRIVFDADHKPSLSSTLTGGAADGVTPFPVFEDGGECVVFPASDPVVLTSGVVAVPVTFSSDNLTATPGIIGNFTKHIKYNGVLFFDGDDWSLTRIDTSLFGDFCAWEPFIVEDPGGHIYVYSRNLNMSGTDDDQYLVAVSFDGGASFTPSVSAKLRIANSRTAAKQVASRRWVATSCDNRIHSTGVIEQNTVVARKNGALFVSRRGAMDFIPGVNFSGDDLYVNYPQFIAHNGDLFVIYTSGIGGTGVRPTLKIARISPIPDDTYAWIHPRSNARFDPISPIDPELAAGPPPYYQFIGGSEAISTTTVAATTGLTYAAWVDWSADSDAIMDARTSGGAFTPTSFGQVFQRKGLSVSTVNFFHGVDLHPGPQTFLAAVIDNTAQTVKLYVNNGASDFTTVTGYYHSILFSTLPADGDTITINGVVYTFRTAPTLTNEVGIGAAVANTTANLAAKLVTNSMQAGDLSPRMILARTDIATFSVSSGSSAITVETSMPLNGGPVHYGYKAISGSSLAGWSGRMYEARIYASALSVANMRSLYNNLADDFSYSAITGTSTAPGSTFLILDPNNPNPGEFPSIGVAAECEVVAANTLKINGEASASLELPYGATQVNLKFKLGAAPTASERYVIATIGDGSGPARIYIDADNPTDLYLEDALIATLTDVTAWNTISFILTSGKVTIGSTERISAGRPRCFLGNAYPQGLLGADKNITFDVSVMHADPA